MGRRRAIAPIWCAWHASGFGYAARNMYEQIVIVGAGQAAVQTVDTLRRKGFTGAAGGGGR